MGWRKKYGVSARSAACVALAGVALIGTSAIASGASTLPSNVKIDWVIDTSAGLVTDAIVTQKAPVSMATASARHILAASAPFAGLSKRDIIPQGTEFGRADKSGRVYCETQRRVKMSSLRCLADSDGDGVFDHVAKTGETQYGYGSKSDIGFTIGWLPVRKWKPIESLIAKSDFEKRAQSESIEFRLHGSTFTMGGELLFNVCARRDEGRSILGFKNEADYCIGRERIRMKDVPSRLRVGGIPVQVSAFDRENKAMTVTFHSFPEGMTF